MAQKTVKGNSKTAEAIRRRRLELNLTIEEASQRAGVGIKTWCRYEAGESIRQDKCKGICKALNWHTLPDVEIDNDILFDYEEYRNHEAWSDSIRERFGDIAAISFTIGSDILLDHLQEDIRELASMPKGYHVGQIDFSWLSAALPPQFLMRYDYDFLYCLQVTVQRLRRVMRNVPDYLPHSVIEEVALYLIMLESEVLIECMTEDMEDAGIEYDDTWGEWIFDLFGDCDLITWLYSDMYVLSDNIYHFDHWIEEHFCRPCTKHFC